MSEAEPSKRAALVRRAVIFQLKLAADGLRDLVLLPVSFWAAIIGLVRGGDEPEKELEQVIEYGRQTERWIDLFDQHSGEEKSHSLASIDSIFGTVEDALRQSYKAAGTSEVTQSEIDEALNAAHEKARNQSETGSDPNLPEKLDQ